MSLESALLRTIEEYEWLLSSGEASSEDIARIHQRMKPVRDLVYEEGSETLIDKYDIQHPNSREIRNRHSTSPANHPDRPITINYIWKDGKIAEVFIYAGDFFFPRCDDEGKWWHERERHLSDYGYNETEFGYMSALRADGSGAFFSSGLRDLDSVKTKPFSAKEQRLYFEKKTRKIKLRLWNTGLRDEGIKAITVSRISLEKGDLTAFFKHIDYHLLDELYADSI